MDVGIKKEIPKEGLEIYHSVQSLSRSLHQPRYDVAVIILLATHYEELLDFLMLQDLFSDIHIILILPDRKKETITTAFKFYPRFISYVDSDFKEVALVLAKMVANAADKENKIGKGGEKINYYQSYQDIDTNKILPS